MKEGKIIYKGKEMLFSYDETKLGKDISTLVSRATEIARIEFDNYLFTLESNGEDDEFWLEVVMYIKNKLGDYMDESFSDCIYEIPKTKEEAKNEILGWFENEINEIIDK